MRNDTTLILVLIYLIAIYLFYKYFKINNQIKKMKSIKALCTDVIVRRTYNKKYYMYFYKFTYKKEEYNISDKFRLPIWQKKIKIKEQYLMYVEANNPNNYITPITTLSYKYYLHGALILIILSCLFFI